MWGVICRISRVELGFAASFRREEVMRFWRELFLCVKAELGRRSVSMSEVEGEGMRGVCLFRSSRGCIWYCVDGKWGVSV